MRLKLLAIIALLVAPAAARAQLTPAQNDIVRRAVSLDGFMTESLHAAFWEGVAPEDTDRVVKQIDLIMVYGYDYRLALWEAAYDAWMTQRALVPRELERALVARFAAGNRLRAPMAPLNEQQIRRDEMLRAAAARIDPPGPPETTLENIELELSQLAATKTRIDLLRSREWPDEPREFLHERAGVWIRDFARHTERPMHPPGTPPQFRVYRVLGVQDGGVLFGIQAAPQPPETTNEEAAALVEESALGVAEALEIPEDLVELRGGADEPASATLTTIDDSSGSPQWLTFHYFWDAETRTFVVIDLVSPDASGDPRLQLEDLRARIRIEPRRAETDNGQAR